jgi:hypothetical protein
MRHLKKTINNHLKNIPGWTTKRKIVVFSVDDYGNIRIASQKARENLGKVGLSINASRFEKLDGLDTANDLSALFETLSSVKDKNGRAAVFTPFANCANIDFEAVKNNNFDHYRYELLPVTLNNLEGYEGTWKLWQQGISEKIFIPQFHGREHLNIKLFNELIQKKDPMLLACIENNSYSGLQLNYYKTIHYNESFCFDKFEENIQLEKILSEGLFEFENVFGYKAKNFNAPGAFEHQFLEKTMSDNGIQYIDSIVIKKEHQGDGVYKNRFRYVGKKNQYNQIYLIRNCVFEPNLTSPSESIASCLKEIETAFFWNKPANISSHRVNFTGSVKEENRAIGNKALKGLLNEIVKRWPDVEFMSSNELGELISVK